MLVMRKRKEGSELEEEEFADVLLSEEEVAEEDAQSENSEKESEEADDTLDDTASIEFDGAGINDGADLDLEADEDEDVNLDLDDDDLDELDFDEDVSSKLDLARAYVDMGDNDGARALLIEVALEGDAEQIQEANELLEKLD